MSVQQIKAELRKFAKPKKENDHKRFFKTGKGEYGEGDLFLGVDTPIKRKISKKYSETPLKEIEKILQSKYHDERQVALFIMINKLKKHYNKYHNASFSKSSSCNNKCKDIYNLYIGNVKYINNWDLVDISAHKIVGRYLENKDRGLLYKFARSKNLWKRRISIISTFWFIKNNDFKDTLNIAKILLCDEHDLIHKAVGWALREVGKKDRNIEEHFLQKHYKDVPRTMLRYAIEKFPENLRQKYLKGKI